MSKAQAPKAPSFGPSATQHENSGWPSRREFSAPGGFSAPSVATAETRGHRLAKISTAPTTDGVIQREHSLSRKLSQRSKVIKKLQQASQKPKGIKKKAWRTRRIGLRQEAVNLAAQDLYDQNVLDPQMLELRLLRSGRVIYKPGGQTPAGATPAGRGMIYEEPAGHDPNVQAQAFPPGFSGGRGKPGEIEIYPGAALDAPFLYSKMVHEANHLRQYQRKAGSKGPFIFGQKSAKYLAAAQEVEAYGSEILSARHTGISEAQLDEIWGRYTDHHDEVGVGGFRRRHLSTDQRAQVDSIHQRVSKEYARLKKNFKNP